MSLAFDTSRRPRRPSEWETLLEAIFTALPTDESNALEWKGNVNLRDKQEVARSVAREILALANRPVSVAMEHFDGYGVLVVGVEPKNVYDIAVLDSAELEPRLTSYIGGADGPGWEMHHYRCQGKQCLVITVDPPRPGDSIYALRTTIPKTEKFKTEYTAGTVFVRRQASSPMAKQDDLNLLVARAITDTTPRLQVQVDAEPKVANSYEVDKELVAQWLDGQRSGLLKSIEDDKNVHVQMDRFGFNPKAPSFSYMGKWVPEERTDDEFRAEVDRYITDLRIYTEGLPKTFGRALAVAPTFVVRNISEHHLEGLRVVLHLGGEAIAWRKADDLPDLRDELPQRPRPFGGYREPIATIFPPGYRPPPIDPTRPRFGRLREATITRDGTGVTITTAPIDLRAGDTAAVSNGVVLFVPEDRDDITMSWAADAKNLPGRVTGRMPFTRADPIDVFGAFLHKFMQRDKQR